MEKRRVVITGMGALTPLGKSAEESWAAAKAGVSDISQKGSLLRLQLGVFHPQALVAVCGHAKYRQRLTLAAGEIPALTLKLKPGEDVLEAARDLVEDLKLAAEEAAGGTP